MSAPESKNQEFIAKTQTIMEAASELKADQVIGLDMREVSSFADSFVIASGGSSRHVRSIAEAIIKAVEESGERPIGVEGLDEGRWVLIDANDVVIHIFAGDSRDDFSLERLWSDAPLIAFKTEEDPES
ncbi:MAG: ribosome silencing factor [Myxococcota bacterium]|nr:ribosome silencing factor [Myxococcota bacterium]